MVQRISLLGSLGLSLLALAGLSLLPVYGRAPAPPTPPKTLTIDLGGGVKLKMAIIPAKGKTFWMGSPESENGRSKGEDQHQVEFSRDYYLGATEVTQAQWLAVMGGKNPSYFCKEGGGKDNVAGLNTDEFPVESVSWDKAQAFCRTLTLRLADGHDYRLPTEAEWEYACRGGASAKNSHPFYLKNGPASALAHGQINFWSKTPYGDGKAGQPLERTAKVGSYPDAVNAFGLFDMHGNVWEWCEDWVGKYPDGKVVDPRGPAKGSVRVIRGGSWGNGGGLCRSADRCATARARQKG